jgi:NOL1/NOP2/fmu family ribosome biogenesis protein
LHASDLPFTTRAVPWNSNSYTLIDAEIRPSQFLEYAVGDFYIQDAGSMLAVTLADVKPDELACDLCAAPGGKSSAILEHLTGSGLLVSNEVISSRVSVLEFNLARTGNPRYVVSNEDSQNIAQRFHEKFDLVLVDAPCSGQTLTSKNKRGENAFDAKQIEHAVARQRRILQDAVRLVKVGGRIVYSTCTFADEENELQMQWLLQEHSDALEPYPDDVLQPWQTDLVPGCYRLWPHRSPSAGAFAARLRKTNGIAPLISQPSSTKPRRAKTHRPRSVVGSTEAFNAFGNLRDVVLVSDTNQIYGFASDSYKHLESELGLFEKSFAKLPVFAEFAKETIVPQHALALLNGSYFTPSQIIAFNDEEARQCIAGSALKPTSIPQDLNNKFAVACWNSKPLGWMKWAGNRWNNLIPPVARLTIQG